MNIFANEGAILHQDALSFHLSHQPPLYVSIHFLLHELVQLVLILLSKIKSTRTQVVDGSNESLEHADEDLDTLLRKYSPLQKIFKKSSVIRILKVAYRHIKWGLILKIYCKGEYFRKRVSKSSLVCSKLSFEPSTTCVRVDLILHSKISTN